MKLIQLNLKGFELLSTGRYQYILASNGLFLAKENDVFRAIVRVEPGPELGVLPIQEVLELKNVKVPFPWVYKAVEFFRHVYMNYRTEAFLWILWNPETHEVTLDCPRQRNHVAHVHVEPDPDISESRLKIGDIHSHPCSSFHSSGDMEDEQHGGDGIHIVIGNLNGPMPDFAASLVVRGRRQCLDPAQVMELDFGFDEKWLRRLEFPFGQHGRSRE